jgi:hypothetical protein
MRAGTTGSVGEEVCERARFWANSARYNVGGAMVAVTRPSH